MRILCFGLLFCCNLLVHAQSGWHAGTVVTLRASELKPVGRTHLNEAGELELIGTAAHFGFRFNGILCLVYAHVPDSASAGYIQYEVDGKYVARVRVSANADSFVRVVARTDGPHEVRIYKSTEASSGPVFITKINGDLASVTIPEVRPIIEFIGNSITSGAAADSSSFPCSLGNYHEHTNGYMAYGPRVARMLGLDYVVNSVSGIGIYRTWNLDTPSMPLVYQNLRLGTGDTAKWNFSDYAPAIVSIALGTNDLSKGDDVHPRAAFDSAIFTGRYIGFVQLVKTKYPKAQIVLLGSPMLQGDRDRILRACLLEVKAETDKNHPSDKPVACFFFRPMEPHGCIGHPSVSDHAEMAAELKPFLQKLLYH